NASAALSAPRSSGRPCAARWSCWGYRCQRGCRINEKSTWCYNPPSRRSNRRTLIMKLDLQDVALRTLILVAGGIAALLLALKGQGQALPALAVGGTLGVCLMARFGPSEQ